MKTYTIQGTYGSKKTKCNIFCAEKRDGSTWYAIEDSQNVNLSPFPLCVGIDVETIEDIDYFYWESSIDSEKSLLKAIES